MIATPIYAVCSTPLSLSPNLQAVLLAKILMYEKNYKRSSAVSVFVIGAPLMVDAFSQLKDDDSSLIAIDLVTAGKSLPQQKYDLIYFNDIQFLAQAKVYAKKHRSVLMTGKKSLVEKGVTLGTSADKGRPRFYLNLTTSFTADLDWEPKVLSIVGTYR